jgi:putative NIF3 family GTP cyclohydrolase 1 type 2
LRWPSTPHYQKAFQRKYSFLVKNDISLFGYHFLLDSHPEIGHNELILRNLGIEDTEVYSDSGGPWGRKGTFDQPQALNEILEQCRDLFKREEIISYKFGKEIIQNVAAVSGSGAPYGNDLQKLINQEIDLYITGEAKESTRELFREAENNFIGGGHYATERLGILELEQQIRSEFTDNVETEFIELWNDV